MPPRSLIRSERPERPPPDLSNIIFRDDAQRTKYVAFYERSVVPTKFVNTECLETLGLIDGVTRLLTKSSLHHLCTEPVPTYEPLVLEFLSSFNYDTPSNQPFLTGSIQFRMFNREYALDQDVVASYLHFNHAPIAHRSIFQELNGRSWEDLAFEFWFHLTGENPTGWRALHASHIQNPAIRYFQRVLGHIIFARSNNHKVNQNELFFLYCALNNIRFNAAPFMFQHIQGLVNAPATNPFLLGGIITTLACALGLGDELLSLSHLMKPAQSLDLTYCRDSHLVTPRHDGRYTLVVNKVPIPYVILPCPERINIRYVQRWRLIEENPQDDQQEHPNEPMDANEEELNQGPADVNQPPPNNPPPITLEAMYAAIQRQDQLVQAMQTNQTETIRLIREMQQEHRDYAIRNESQYAEIATYLHDLDIRVNDSPDRRRRVRTRGASSSQNRNDEE